MLQKQTQDDEARHQRKADNTKEQHNGRRQRKSASFPDGHMCKVLDIE